MVGFHDLNRVGIASVSEKPAVKRTFHPDMSYKDNFFARIFLVTDTW